MFLVVELVLVCMLGLLQAVPWTLEKKLLVGKAFWLDKLAWLVP